MKNLSFLLCAFFLLSYLACVPPVVFSEPQPQGYEPQNAFPMYYRGTFFCESDSALVYVKSQLIYKKKTFAVALTRNELESIEEATLIGNDLYIESFPEPFYATLRGDSVFSNIILTDTLFQIGEGQVLTQFRGHQILNKKGPNGNWEVLILSLSYDFDLMLSSATYPEDLQRLNEITPVEELSRGDTIQYKIAPSVYEFNQILEEQLIFNACDFYERVALPVEI